MSIHYAHKIGKLETQNDQEWNETGKNLAIILTWQRSYHLNLRLWKVFCDWGLHSPVGPALEITTYTLCFSSLA